MRTFLIAILLSDAVVGDAAIYSFHISASTERTALIVGTTRRLIRYNFKVCSEQLAVQLSRPYLADLADRFDWPVSIATYELNGMAVRLSTATSNRRSPVRVLYKPLELFTRAHGLAYLVFASRSRRKQIFDPLSRSIPDAKIRSAEKSRLLRVLRDVKTNGFAERDPRIARRDSASTISVPILLDGHSLASIGISFYLSSIPRIAAIQMFVKPLSTAAKAISGELRQTRTAKTCTEHAGSL
jgi:IclR family mhp operon transcriptional activator